MLRSYSLNDAFFKERESLGLVSKKDNIPEAELNALDEATAKDVYYQDY